MFLEHQATAYGPMNGWIFFPGVVCSYDCEKNDPYAMWVGGIHHPSIV